MKKIKQTMIWELPGRPPSVGKLCIEMVALIKKKVWDAAEMQTYLCGVTN